MAFKMGTIDHCHLYLLVKCTDFRPGKWLNPQSRSDLSSVEMDNQPARHLKLYNHFHSGKYSVVHGSNDTVLSQLQS